MVRTLLVDVEGKEAAAPRVPTSASPLFKVD
jgi:hypothetical protein